MSAAEELAMRLRAWEIVLRRHLALIAPHSDPRSFAMRLLVSQPDRVGEPPFLKELHRVLCGGGTRLGEDEGGSACRKDLGEWLGPGSETLHTPANWLKIKIEELPLRLFVAIDPSEWSVDGKSPLKGDCWTDPDPFFRKRICWLDCRELIDDGPLALPEKPTDDLVKSKAVAIEWLQRLRLRWIRHLAVEVARLWDDGIAGGPTKANPVHMLKVLLHLLDSDSGSRSLKPPDTVPHRWRDSGGGTASDGRGCIALNLDALDFKNEAWIEAVGLDPGDLVDGLRGVVFRRHCGAADYNVSNKLWRPERTLFSRDGGVAFDDSQIASYFGTTCFEGVITGAGRSFSLFDSALLKSAADKSDKILDPIILDAAEQGVMRLGISDERFQQWLWGNDEQQRGWVVAQRVTPVIIATAGTEFNNYLYGQPPYQGSPHFKIDPEKAGDPPAPCFELPGGIDLLWPRDHRGLDALVIHQGLLDKAFDARDSGQQLTARMLQLKAAVPFVFVTSGRGRPENLPWGCKFLPYAAIEGAIHGVYLEKLLLWRALVAA